MSVAIEIQNLSKKYLIKQKGGKKAFMALRDVSLNVEKGKVLGIIGRNGSGKSTLLKILSRITFPTNGQVDIYGSIASLLEVGTGFHPELSGRDNIFLNGSILGMKRKEIEAQFDEIVSFAGVEDFLDTPVKHYSSGMYVRLAFAVAAHLSASILLVDEVLAVGDADFQAKCLQKMDDATKESGRTIVFVSHNMSAIRRLCDTVVWIDEGEIKMQGPAQEVCDAYLGTQTTNLQQQSQSSFATREGDGKAHFTKIEATSPQNSVWYTGLPASIMMEVKSTLPKKTVLEVRLNVFDRNGTFITLLQSENEAQGFVKSENEQSVTCKISKLPLLPGAYFITANLFANNELQDGLKNVLKIKVEKGEYFGHKTYQREYTGVEIDQTWQLNTIAP